MKGPAKAAAALKHRDSFSEHEKVKNVVLESEIQNLRDGEFYMKSLNVNPCKDFTKKWSSKHMIEAHQHFHGYPPLEFQKEGTDLNIGLNIRFDDDKNKQEDEFITL